MTTWILLAAAVTLVLLGLACLFRTEGGDRYVAGAVAFLSAGIWAMLIAAATAMGS